MTTQENDVLLKEDDNRFVMFPIVDKDVWQMYKTGGLFFGELKKLIYQKIWLILKNYQMMKNILFL